MKQVGNWLDQGNASVVQIIYVNHYLSYGSKIWTLHILMVPHPPNINEYIIRSKLVNFQLTAETIQFQWTMQHLGNDKLRVKYVLSLTHMHNGHLDHSPAMMIFIFGIH